MDSAEFAGDLEEVEFSFEGRLSASAMDDEVGDADDEEAREDSSTVGESAGEGKGESRSDVI